MSSVCCEELNICCDEHSQEATFAPFCLSAMVDLYRMNRLLEVLGVAVLIPKEMFHAYHSQECGTCRVRFIWN
jgi:hypothetical protein